MSNLLKKHNLVGFLIACLLLGLDLYLKMISSTQFVKTEDAISPDIYIGRREEIFSIGEFGFFSFNHVRNFGALWNVAAGIDKSFRPVLFGALSVVSFVVLWFIHKKKWVPRSVLGLIAIGAASNFLDRIRYGYVVDYLDARFQFGDRHFRFPNFNLADVYLVVGLLISIWIFLQLSKKESKEGGVT